VLVVFRRSGGAIGFTFTNSGTSGSLQTSRRRSNQRLILLMACHYPETRGSSPAFYSRVMSEVYDHRWMLLAIELACRCPPSQTAYSVGAVIVGANGAQISSGFSREKDPVAHAEETALGKLSVTRPRLFDPERPDPRLQGATIYSTLEPCAQRNSRPRTCTQLIIAAGLRRVVFAWREPSLFVPDATGYELLEAAGLEVTELPELSAEAAAPNRHLALRGPGQEPSL
jgi:diaminohydroxyphosphoribosylaminopyrimidine deaminase / 5-amino-6-(5-phosphoribosylamino)uracil reductase